MAILCFIGDGNSIHIRRWAGWFQKKGWAIQLISLTRGAREYNEYDVVREIIPIQGMLGYSRTILPIRKAAKQLQPDIVHGHYLTASGFYCATSGGKHKIVSAWGSDVYKDAQERLKGQCIKYAIKHSDVCLADSNHLVGEIKKLVPKVDVRKVIFGIDTEKFKPNPIKHNSFRFLSIRASSEIYNPMEILRAFQKANLDAELWMYRPSAESFDVMDYVNSNDYLKSHVVWLDKRSYDKMPELYNSVDVGISIPNWDSSSTTMNECMACGVPVIASAIPQNAEWICIDNGFLTPNLTLKNVMDMFARFDEKAIRQMGANAREKIVKDADWNTEMSKAEKIYEEVLDGKA